MKPMRFYSVLLAMAVLAAADFRQGQAADPAQVQQSIQDGATFLRSQFSLTNGGERVLVALTLYKAGLPKDSPEIQDTVEEILGRFENGAYVPSTEHVYAAGVEATLLADLDAEKYHDELAMMGDYFVKAQKPQGAWDYPVGRETSPGDTSVTQYGALGLWAVARAGVDVDPEVWEKLLAWHVKYQNNDGGFAYVPGMRLGKFQNNSSLNMSVNAVGSMHIAMLQLNPKFVPLQDSGPVLIPNERKAEDAPKFGVLEEVDLDATPESERRAGRITSSAIASLKKAYAHVIPRFRAENSASDHFAYYYYSLERMAALAHIEQIGSHNWFDECSDFIVANQLESGGWDLSNHLGPIHDTCFCVLFLTRSTGKLLKHVKEKGYGDGMLAGGRGLPDDLNGAQYDGRGVKKPEPPKEPLDQLLASLSKTGDVNLEALQSQIVEKVQLGNKEDLVGQVDRLVSLLDNPDPAVRQTVVWALGRTDDLELARHLIHALNDEDLGVIIEARNALCWISRRPTGFGLAQDPLSDLPPNASEQAQRDAITAWHSQLILNWAPWYLENRPYQDRGDEFESELKSQIEQIKLQNVSTP